MAATQPTYDDILRLFQETTLKFQETDRKFQETDRKFQDTERLIKDMSRETDLKIKEVTSAIGKLGKRLGDCSEDAVRPSAARLFREWGIDVHEVQQNVSVQRGEEGTEIDLSVVNDSDAIAIECNSNLKTDDVNEHQERLAKLKRLIPRYAETNVMGAVAAMVIPDHVARYAYQKGLFVIGQSGGHLEIRNDAMFTPAIW